MILQKSMRFFKGLFVYSCATQQNFLKQIKSVINKYIIHPPPPNPKNWNFKIHTVNYIKKYLRKKKIIKRKTKQKLHFKFVF